MERYEVRKVLLTEYDGNTLSYKLPLPFFIELPWKVVEEKILALHNKLAQGRYVYIKAKRI